MFFVVRRATLLIPSGPSHDPARKHLFICMTDPVGKDRETLLVSVSSITPGVSHDPACVLFAGDHPFIQRDSCVDYHHARLEHAESLERGVRSSVLAPHAILDGAVFARVCRGIETSRRLAPKYRAFYEASNR